MYEQRKINAKNLNSWFGKSFITSDGKSPSLKNWVNIREFGYLDETFNEARGANLILQPGLFTVLDVDDAEATKKVTKYLQSKEIPYLEQQTRRGVHIYFKHDRKVRGGDGKWMLCNLQTDVKNKALLNMNLAMKTDGKWRKWFYYGDSNTKIGTDLTPMLSKIPDILRTIPKKLVYFDNSDIGPGTRSSNMYIYSHSAAKQLFRDFPQDFRFKVKNLVRDYNDYFVDGMEKYDLEQTILKQLGNINTTLIKERVNKQQNERLFQNHLEAGLSGEYLIDKKAEISQYINNLETYLISQPEVDITKSVRTYNTYVDIRKNLFKVEDDNAKETSHKKMFIKLTHELGLSLEDSEASDEELKEYLLEDEENAEVILNVYEMLLNTTKFKNFKLQRLLSYMAPDFHSNEIIPQTPLDIVSIDDTNLKKFNQLYIKERIEQMKQDGLLPMIDDIPTLVTDLQNAYFARIMRKKLSPEQMDLLNTWVLDDEEDEDE